MKAFQASFEANQNLIRNLDIQVRRLDNHIAERSSMAIREENSIEIKAHERSLHKGHYSREKGEEKTIFF